MTPLYPRDLKIPGRSDTGDPIHPLQGSRRPALPGLRTDLRGTRLTDTAWHTSRRAIEEAPAKTLGRGEERLGCGDGAGPEEGGRADGSLPPQACGAQAKRRFGQERPARTESENRLNLFARHGSGGDDVTTRAPCWQTRLRISLHVRASIGDRAWPTTSQRPGPRPLAERKCYEDS